MDIEKLVERYHNLANRWENGEQLLLDGTMRIQDELRGAATALSTLQAKNEKLRSELEQVKNERDSARATLNWLELHGQKED